MKALIGVGFRKDILHSSLSAVIEVQHKKALSENCPVIGLVSIQEKAPTLLRSAGGCAQDD